MIAGGRLTQRLARLWRRPRLAHSIVVLGAILTAGSALITLIALERSRAQVIDAASDNLAGTAAAVAVQTARDLSRIDAALAYVGQAFTARPAIATHDPVMGATLREFAEHCPMLANLLIVDPAGRVIDAAAPDTAIRQIAIADSDHENGDRPLIGPLQTGPAPVGWWLPVRRPLLRGNARIGYVVAVVRVAMFTDMFAAFDSRNGNPRIALVLGDDPLAAATPAAAAVIGSRLPWAGSLLSTRAAEGVAADASAQDRVDWLRGWHRVPGWPLTVIASRDRRDILRPWYGQCAASLAALLLFALTAGGLTVLALRALGRQQVAMLRQRRSEQRLSRQTALLQNTLENLGEGVSVFSASGHLVAWNTRFGEMLELPNEMIGGKTLREILLFQAQRGDLGEIADVEADVAERLATFYRELPATRERTTAAGRVLRITRRAMEGGAVISVYSDITEMRAFERQIVQASSQSELANRAKSEFLANMSHELRTPLNAIIGFSEIISNQIFGPVKNPRYLEYMTDIHSSSLHLLAIINDVLDMSKIEAGRLELTPEPLSAQQAIGEALRMMQENARERDIALTPEFPVEEVVILADPRAIKQIFINLLSNAVKFSHPGSEVRIRLSVDHSRMAVMEVADAGIGMSEEELERALQPFGQAKSVITREYGGTGLGLPITKGLVEAHGGRLTLTSRPGHGTTVCVTFPTEQTRLNQALEWLHSGMAPAGD
jgi:signal transduction histidine kinase